MSGASWSPKGPRSPGHCQMTKTFRQLANLVAANWRTSSPPTGEPHCRQLVNLCQLAKTIRQLANLVAANWSTSSSPTGQPHRRQLVNLIGANWRTSPAPTGEPHRRQLVNLTGANWATSSPPTGQPHRRQLAKPSPTGEIPQMTKTIRQLAKHPPMLAPSCENI